MLTDERIEKLRKRTFSTDNPFCPVDRKSMWKAAKAVEAEVRKDYDALIRQMLEALEWLHLGASQAGLSRDPAAAITAARARLLDSDLSKLTERGAKAWAGVDPQKLREGGAL